MGYVCGILEIEKKWKILREGVPKFWEGFSRIEVFAF